MAFRAMSPQADRNSSLQAGGIEGEFGDLDATVSHREKLVVGQLCIQIHSQGDTQDYEKVRSLIADRYGNDRYHPVDEDQPADVEVRISRPRFEPICVLDAFRHTALQWKLLAELGNSRVKFDMLSDERINEELPVILRYRIVPEAQLELFQRFLDDLPAFLTSCFPISSPSSPLEIKLDEIQLKAPADKPRAGVISTRWHVRAHLKLTDKRDERIIESGWFVLTNLAHVV
ncbi:hypothetical protein [Singulisphaera sp. PoT]|uniref:hypothetical protein n=1 Tax=Singulisphaera sp. PoT TaxID=3411797 RepID=UPI003BF48FEB